MNWNKYVNYAVLGGGKNREHIQNLENDKDPYEGDKTFYELYKWFDRIGREAEEWIDYNAHNTPINGGEDW